MPRVEVPCSSCGNAAAELAAPELTTSLRVIISRVARMLGVAGELDPDAPIIGMTAPQFSQAFNVRCLACVDGVVIAAAVGAGAQLADGRP